MPNQLGMQAYRRLNFGQLATMHVVDTRQYRSYQPKTLAEAENPAQTMTGQEQEQWLVNGMENSGRAWNLLANQVMWAENDQSS
jgi:alkaline phosphatase D